MQVPMMQPNTGMGGGGLHSNNMMDNFKSMMLTMIMVKGTTSTGGGGDNNGLFQTMLIMFIVSFMDIIGNYAKRAVQVGMHTLENYLTQKADKLSLITSSLSSNSNKIKKASVLIKIEMSGKNPTADAIIDTLTHLPNVKCILNQNNHYTINYHEEIEISKGLYAQLVSSSAYHMYASSSSAPTRVSLPSPTTNALLSSAVSSSAVSSSTVSSASVSAGAEEAPLDTGSNGGMSYIDVYSYTMNMETLRDEISGILKNFLIKMTNKLGNNIYYFSQAPGMIYRDMRGHADHSKMPECLHFTMKPFVTNRSFSNLFGEEVKMVRKRVEFFRDNKDWYDNKGVPYTLGILVSGNPGSGKTSMIKCIANELKRHIINIHLSDNMTKAQLENLFYSEQLHVTQNGKTETYTIPINKRIYVLEDVDCQCEIILDRGDNQSAEQILAKKNAELKEEIEKLKYALAEINQGKKVVLGGERLPSGPENKDKDKDEQITLSFLLNLFDGVLETPGRITFMTTNFVDKLDKAFTRPGRIDVISKFGFAKTEQLIEIVEHRYDTVLTEAQLLLIENVQWCITPAEVSRILFENFDNLDGALAGLLNYMDEYIKKEQEKKERDDKVKMQIALLETDAYDRQRLQQLEKEKENKSTNQGTTEIDFL